MTGLPEHVTYGPGPHGDHHAALKADYDQRHPDAPLPEFEVGPVHREIHRLLAADHNENHPDNALTVDIQAGDGGHLRHHAVLHASYNQRHQP